jgi:signal transduction histidine kinase
MFSVALMLLAALVAERRRSEEMMHATRAQLITARQREHQRIGRELHDNIVQRLTLLGLDVDELRTETNLPVRPDFDKLYNQLLAISEATRDLSHELHPFALEYLGLNRALEKLSRDVSAQCGIAVHFSENNVTCPLPSTVASCFFRVAQEALQNVAQHSHAKTAVMKLTVEGALAVLRISDEGVGMGPMNKEGTGLTYLREHLLVLGGRLRIMSAPDKGTMIEASVPIQIPS